MISEDFAFFGFDESSWNRLVSLVVGAKEPRGVVVVVVNGAGVAIRGFHTRCGSLDPTTLPPAGDLEALCDAMEADACIVIRDRATEDFADYLADPLDPERDLVARITQFVRVLRELGNGRWVRIWPNPFPDLRLAAAPAARSATDLLLPDGRCAVLGIFDQGALWTGAVLRRNDGQFDVFAGPVAMRDWTGTLGGDWKRDHRVLARAVERKLGAVQVGLFMERKTAVRLLQDRSPGGWALAFAARELLVYPLPAFASAALGLDVLRGTAQLALQVFEGIEPEEMASIAQGFWKGFTDGRGLEGLLDGVRENPKDNGSSGTDVGEDN